jgi:hypothetical protein
VAQSPIFKIFNSRFLINFLVSNPSCKVFNLFIIEAKLIQDHYKRQAIERFQKSIPNAEEAITPPWAIQYNLSQRPKTSNLKFRIYLSLRF